MNEKKLIKGIKNQNDSIYEEIINNFSKLLWVIASSILSNKEDIEECISDVFVDLWNNPNQYNSDKGTLKTFLVIKTRSKSLDKLRKSKNESKLLDLDEYIEQIKNEDNDIESFIESQNYKPLYDAIENLREPNREILIRRFFFEEKPCLISKTMNLPIKEIENRIYRGKQQLKKVLAGKKEDLGNEKSEELTN